MARTIQVIQQQIFDGIAADENLSGLNSTSKVAIYRLFAFVVSYCAWTLEILFDTHKLEVSEIIGQKFPHRASWYGSKAKAFQYGFDLIHDTDQYDNTGFTDDQIEASRIIKYSAVTQSAGQLLIKIATETAGVLSPISVPQKASFDAYISEIADCGVKYLVVNHLPDILLLEIQLFCDPLVLNDKGMSILNGNYPVQDAIQEFMKNLPFNGEIILFDLETKLKTVEGVKIPNLISAKSQAINLSTGLYEEPEPIDVKTIPVSGYFTIPNFDNISYVV
ncbi:nucleotidyltransferase [Flavobacterium sp. Fl-318]|uniref:Nucleotidyltransferase n=1 Tax=Flavobacterium cupriresistens TaxID=2893885 RepID=A0ABU4RBU1_9FLAO|nr:MULTISPECIES: nucleotidyltransferase [unclassified Flavobacterium]MDX6187996.1 nucleotidyltransferase [Flavobacterium sp. Fl-318]UFH42084.1 nucleotidyltransferase [Flavobacterium sp. F-323]